MPEDKLRIPKAARQDWIGNNQTNSLTIYDRIFQKISVDANGCFVWQGSRNTNGYARIRIDGRLRSVHLLLWEGTHGQLPKGYELDHLCRTRPCINLSHLEPVTHAENCVRGHQTKLTRVDVQSIRDARSNGAPIAHIAQAFGVVPGTIGYVLHTGWKHVT